MVYKIEVDKLKTQKYAVNQYLIESVLSKAKATFDALLAQAFSR